jgi:hypothetical protein
MKFLYLGNFGVQIDLARIPAMTDLQYLGLSNLLYNIKVEARAHA